MGPDLVPLTACPACGATLRPGAPWCTLCYADLRPVPAAPPTPTPTLTALPMPAPAPPPPQVDDMDPGPTWPCSRCHSLNALALPRCAACGADFLAAVRDDDVGLVLPGLGDLTTMSRGRRMAIAFGAVAALVLPLALITLLLTGQPPAPTPLPTSPVSTVSAPP